MTALRNLKEPRGRKARWLDRLSEYEFRVVHRPGRQHLNADAMSRVVTDVPSPPPSPPPLPRDVPLSAAAEVPVAGATFVSSPDPPPDCFRPQDILSAQSADPDLAAVLSWYDAASGKFVRPPEEDIRPFSRLQKFLWSSVSQLRLIDKVLYLDPPFAHDVDVEHPVLIVPVVLQSAALASVHSLPGAGHFGIEKTLHLARQRFFWQGMASDVQIYVQSCPTCAQLASKNPVHRAPLQSMAAGFPFEFVALDIVGPLPVTPTGNRYVLVIVDYFTRWAEAVPLSAITAEAVALAFIHGWVSRFGAPRRLHSDQGSQFEARLFQSLRTILGIRKSRTTSYHPEGNGLVERLNRTLIHHLKAFVGPTDVHWDIHLPLVLLAYRAAVHSSTGFTPSRLLYGAELRLPVDLVFPPPDPPELSPFAYVQLVRDRLAQAHSLARVQLAAVHRHQKSVYDAHCSGASFVVGDLVWLHDKVIHAGESAKFHRYWSGPFRVVRVNGPTSYTLSMPGCERTVHFNRLKKAVTVSGPVTLPLPDDDLPRCVPPLQPPSSDPVRTSSPVSRRSGRVRTAPARLADYVLD